MRFQALGFAFFTAAALITSPLRQTDVDLRIDSPVENAVVYGIVDISGSAAAPGMVRFRVEFAYEPNTASTWFLIAEGTGPIPQGLLASWDTTKIREGIYSLRLIISLRDGSMQDVVIKGIRVRRAVSFTPVSATEEIVPPAENPLQAPPQTAFAFPAPTATLSILESLSTPTAGISHPLVLAGVLGAACSGIVLVFWQLRSRWLWWNRRRFIRSFGKDGSRHE